MKATNEYVPKLDLRLTQESEETLYELAPCGYCSCLPDGTLVKLNQTLLGWVGYAREEVVAGHCLQHLLTIGGALHFETYGIPLLLLQGHVRELSYELRHKDGSTQPVLLNATLVYDTHGSPLVARVTLFDITDRRRYEQELLRAKKLADSQREQLAQANAALLEKNKLLTRINADLDTFIYTASHECAADPGGRTRLGAGEGVRRTLQSNHPPTHRYHPPTTVPGSAPRNSRYSCPC
jgi:sigma-B regulation protein RsbU (phosphoserine phosphatase)